MFLLSLPRGRCAALLLVGAALVAFPGRSLAQIGYPTGGFNGGGFGRGGFGNQFGRGNQINGGAQFNQNQGIVANQSNTRSRFALNTSVSGAGVLNSALDTVQSFGTALNTNNQMGSSSSYGPFGGRSGSTGNPGLNPANQINNGLGSLTKQPPGVIMSALYNGSPNFAIYGNQQVQSYGGATPQYGGFGGGYGGYGGFPQNGGYGY